MTGDGGPVTGILFRSPVTGPRPLGVEEYAYR